MRPFAPTRTIALAAALLCASLRPLRAQSPADSAPPEGQQSVVIRGGWLFTATNDQVVRNQGILVVAGRLLGVNRPLTAQETAGARVVTLDDENALIPDDLVV